MNRIATPPKTVRVGVAAVSLLAAVFLAAILMFSPPGSVFAATDLDLDCRGGVITEGDSIDVKVRGDWDGQLHVWWYTTDGTATGDEDFDALDSVRQGSRKSGNTMTRTIEAIDDDYPEADETFTLRFSRQDNRSNNTSCEITIVDNDFGIREVSISSEPADGLAYRAGEEIEFAAHTNAVVKVNYVGDPDLYMDFQLEDGDENLKKAQLHYPDDTAIYGAWTVHFRYTVQEEDIDPDGVEVDDSDGTTGLTGTFNIKRQINPSSAVDPPISRYYHGRHFPDALVDGSPHATAVEVISSPPQGDTYHRDDNIEVQLTFSEPVDVTGNVRIGILVGVGGSAWRAAAYNRGTGTDTIVFRYTVQEDDSDTQGLRIAQGNDSSGFHIGDGQSIETVDDQAAVSRLYPGTEHLSDHKLDGSTTSPPIFVSAETNRAGNRITITFSKEVSPPALLETISEDFNIGLGRFYAAVFDVYGEIQSRPLDVRNASLSEDKLTLNVHRPIKRGAQVKVSYNNLFAKESVGMFVDSDGNSLGNFDKQSVENSSNSSTSSLGWPYVNGPYALKVNEGGTKRYGVKLSHDPEGTTTIDISVYPEGALTLNKNSLTFNRGNYNIEKYVTITGPADDNTTNGWARITHTPGGTAHRSDGLRIKVLVEDSD